MDSDKIFEMVALTSKVAGELHDRVGELQRDVEKLRDQVAKLEDDFPATHVRLNLAISRMEDLRHDHQSRLAEVERDQAATDSAMAHVERSISELDDRLHEANRNAEAAATDAADVERVVRSLDLAVSDLVRERLPR